MRVALLTIFLLAIVSCHGIKRQTQNSTTSGQFEGIKQNCYIVPELYRFTEYGESSLSEKSDFYLALVDPVFNGDKFTLPVSQSLVEGTPFFILQFKADSMADIWKLQHGGTMRDELNWDYSEEVDIPREKFFEVYPDANYLCSIKASGAKLTVDLKKPIGGSLVKLEPSIIENEGVNQIHHFVSGLPAGDYIYFLSECFVVRLHVTETSNPRPHAIINSRFYYGTPVELKNGIIHLEAAPEVCTDSWWTNGLEIKVPSTIDTTKLNLYKVTDYNSWSNRRVFALGSVFEPKTVGKDRIIYPIPKEPTDYEPGSGDIGFWKSYGYVLTDGTLAWFIQYPPGMAGIAKSLKNK